MLFWIEHSDFTISLSEKQKASDQKNISEKMREFMNRVTERKNLIDSECIKLFFTQGTKENRILIYREKVFDVKLSLKIKLYANYDKAHSVYEFTINAIAGAHLFLLINYVREVVADIDHGSLFLEPRNFF